LLRDALRTNRRYQGGGPDKSYHFSGLSNKNVPENRVEFFGRVSTLRRVKSINAATEIALGLTEKAVGLIESLAVLRNFLIDAYCSAASWARVT